MCKARDEWREVTGHSGSVAALCGRGALGTARAEVAFGVEIQIDGAFKDG